MAKKHNQIARREIAQKNLETRTKRSSKEQLDILDKKLGIGIGATKERARLVSMLNVKDEKSKVVSEEIIEKKPHLKAKERRQKQESKK